MTTSCNFYGSASDRRLQCRFQAAERGVKRIRIHTLTDGRDTEDGSSVKFMEQLQKDVGELQEKGCDAKVASGGGRMCTTMDRYEVCFV